MDLQKPNRTLAVAKQVSEILAQCKIRCMVVGAAALAVHGYARQSVDLDLAVYANPFEAFRDAHAQLTSAGFTAELVMPDTEDPLGGVINVTGVDFEPIQIINFDNPMNRRGIHRLVGEILSEIQPGESGLAVVPLELLVLLKLFAGDRQSLRDIHELLRVNPNCDRNKITELARRAGLDKDWAALTTE
jgi:hypothetical protein